MVVSVGTNNTSWAFFTYENEKNSRTQIHEMYKSSRTSTPLKNMCHEIICVSFRTFLTGGVNPDKGFFGKNSYGNLMILRGNGKLEDFQGKTKK